MKDRNELGKVFQGHFLKGLGAEVGCYQGDFSKVLSQDYRGVILSIDYFDPNDFLYTEGLYEKAVENLKGTKCVVIKGKSTEVAKTIPDGGLDWVYIDADHRYESAKADIEAWFPKVREGGVFSGHDYIKDYYVHDIVFGVWKAVDEFCEKYGYKVNIIHNTTAPADFASWWFIK